jgi:hypothetical protein
MHRHATAVTEPFKHNSDCSCASCAASGLNEGWWVEGGVNTPIKNTQPCALRGCKLERSHAPLLPLLLRATTEHCCQPAAAAARDYCVGRAVCQRGKLLVTANLLPHRAWDGDGVAAECHFIIHNQNAAVLGFGCGGRKLVLHHCHMNAFSHKAELNFKQTKGAPLYLGEAPK